MEAGFDLNVKAALYVSRAVARRLLETGQAGSIINISSQMGHVGSPRRVLYCASKHAMEGMTKALAWELGAHGIRVNSICPTFIETPMTSAMFDQPGFRQWVCDRIALGRAGRVDEVMGAAVFLASSASSLMTGSALMLDGGWTAACKPPRAPRKWPTWRRFRNRQSAVPLRRARACPQQRGDRYWRP